MILHLYTSLHSPSDSDDDITRDFNSFGTFLLINLLYCTWFSRIRSMSGGRLRFFAVATSFLGPAGTSILSAWTLSFFLSFAGTISFGVTGLAKTTGGFKISCF